jgi:hypothetical protein
MGEAMREEAGDSLDMLNEKVDMSWEMEFVKECWPFLYICPRGFFSDRL